MYLLISWANPAKPLTYVGITTDLARRLRAHNGELKGGARFTRRGRPWAIAYSEPAPNHGAALRRELELKKLSPARKHALIASQTKNL